MDFLTKTIGTLTGTAIPYTFGEVRVIPKCESGSSTSIWKVYDGVSDKDSRPVTIFEFDLRHPSNANYVQNAKNAVAKQRALSLLPGVLTVVDVIESAKNIYLITEHVVTFGDVSSSMKKGEALLGVYQLAVGLKYINIEGSSIHGNLRAGNIFINDFGEWKIAGFEFTFNWKDHADLFSLYSTYSSFTSSHNFPVPPEFASSGPDIFRSQLSDVKSLKFDSYLFGILAYEILTGTDAREFKSMASHTKIEELPIGKLVSPNPGLRITSEQFLNNGLTSYFNSEEIDSFSKFTQISIMDLSSKLEIFKILVQSDISIQFLSYKVMPEIAKAFYSITKNEKNIQTTLIYLAYVIVEKDTEEKSKKSFDECFKPLLFKAFSLEDRSVRTILLKILPRVVDRLTKYEVQDNIYPHLAKGFYDTDVTLRTETLLSIQFIKDKMSDRQLNNDLLRDLAVLQRDSNSKLRANTVVCLTKIAEKLQQNNVLVAAFGKALKDPDYVTRLCALRGFEELVGYFTPEVCCSRILSSLSPALLDKSSFIRSEAEKCFELYMKKIRDEAQTLGQNDDDDHIERDVSGLDQVMDSVTLENLGETLLGITFTPSSTPLAQSRVTLNGNNSNSSLPDTAHLRGNYSQTNLKTSITANDDFDLEEELDDGWGFDEEGEGEEDYKPISTKPVARTFGNMSISGASSNTNGKTKVTATKPEPKGTKKTLVLGKSKPVAKLELNITPTVEDEDDGWGDGW